MPTSTRPQTCACKYMPGRLSVCFNYMSDMLLHVIRAFDDKKTKAVPELQGRLDIPWYHLASPTAFSEGLFRADNRYSKRSKLALQTTVLKIRPSEITVRSVTAYSLPVVCGGFRCEAPEMYFVYLLAAVLHPPTALCRHFGILLLFDQRLLPYMFTSDICHL